MRNMLLPFWAAILVGLIGCGGFTPQTATNTTIPITVLLEADQCQASGILASAIWVRKAEQLDSSLARQIKADHPDAIPWDSDTLGVLVIHMGRQTTGGYRLSLAVPILEVRNRIGMVTVTRHRPAIGAIVTQAISSPCLALQFPYQNLKSVYIHDQEGRLLAEVTVR